MKRVCVFLCLLTVALMVRQQAAHAVIWGEPDSSNEYPEVAAVFTNEGDAAGFTQCAGVLLNDDTLLTAAHCVDDAVDFPTVLFGANLFGATAFALGFPIIHPDYNAIQDGPDIAVLKLFFPPVPGNLPPATSAQLPSAGHLDEAARARGALHDRIYTTAGYGIAGDYPDIGQTVLRHIGEQSLQSVGSTAGELYANFTSNTGAVSGGACLGDSGGPVFAPDGVTVVGVNSFGITTNCVGTGFVSRTDIQEVLDFINALK